MCISLSRGNILPSGPLPWHLPYAREVTAKRAVKLCSLSSVDREAKFKDILGGHMRARQSLWTAQQGWTGTSKGPADLLLAFGGTGAVTDKSLWNNVLRRHPDARVLGCNQTTITVFCEDAGA